MTPHGGRWDQTCAWCQSGWLRILESWSGWGRARKTRYRQLQRRGQQWNARIRERGEVWPRGFRRRRGGRGGCSGGPFPEREGVQALDGFVQGLDGVARTVAAGELCLLCLLRALHSRGEGGLPIRGSTRGTRGSGSGHARPRPWRTRLRASRGVRFGFSSVRGRLNAGASSYGLRSDPFPSPLFVVSAFFVATPLPHSRSSPPSEGCPKGGVGWVCIRGSSPC